MSERDEFLKKLGAPQFEAILEGGESAFPLLSHPDKGVRGAALIQLSNKCPSDLRERFAQKCQDIVENDSDWANQVNAIDWLGRHYKGTRNTVISRFFARLVLLENMDKRVRVFAYLALREVHYGINVHNRTKRIELIEKWLSQAHPDSPISETSSKIANTHSEINYVGIEEIDFEFVGRFINS